MAPELLGIAVAVVADRCAARGVGRADLILAGLTPSLFRLPPPPLTPASSSSVRGQNAAQMTSGVATAGPAARFLFSTGFDRRLFDFDAAAEHLRIVDMQPSPPLPPAFSAGQLEYDRADGRLYAALFSRAVPIRTLPYARTLVRAAAAARAPTLAPDARWPTGAVVATNGSTMSIGMPRMRPSSSSSTPRTGRRGPCARYAVDAAGSALEGPLHTAANSVAFVHGAQVNVFDIVWIKSGVSALSREKERAPVFYLCVGLLVGTDVVQSILSVELGGDCAQRSYAAVPATLDLFSMRYDAARRCMRTVANSRTIASGAQGAERAGGGQFGARTAPHSAGLADVRSA